jgi:hypothetical protein
MRSTDWPRCRRCGILAILLTLAAALGYVTGRSRKLPPAEANRLSRSIHDPHTNGSAMPNVRYTTWLYRDDSVDALRRTGRL